MVWKDTKFYWRARRIKNPDWLRPIMAIAWDASATTITSVISAVCIAVWSCVRDSEDSQVERAATGHKSDWWFSSHCRNPHNPHTLNILQSVWQTPRHCTGLLLPFMNLRGEEEEMIVISIILADRRVSISLTVISKVDKLVPLSGLTRISLLLAGPRTWSVWTSGRPAWWRWTPPWSPGRCPGPRSARRLSSRWMSLRRKSVDGDDKMIREGFKENL